MTRDEFLATLNNLLFSYEQEMKALFKMPEPNYKDMNHIQYLIGETLKEVGKEPFKPILDEYSKSAYCFFKYHNKNLGLKMMKLKQYIMDKAEELFVEKPASVNKFDTSAITSNTYTAEDIEKAKQKNEVHYY